MRGSIRKRGKNSWEVRLDLPLGADGKRRRKSVHVKGTKSDAQSRLRELFTLSEGGMPLNASKATVEACLHQWLDSQAPRLRKRTVYGYRNVLRRYVFPTLGGLLVTRLQPRQIETLYSSLIGEGLSPRTVLQTHRILKKGLNQAMRWNLIGRNPVNLVDPPSFEMKEMLALDTHQLAMLLKHAEGSKFGPVFHLAAFTGLRRGELVGLKWQDVDLENRLISVRREIIFVPGEGHLTTQPKSQSSRRTVDITDMTASVMRRHRSKQAQHRMYLGSVWKDEGWVFTNPDGGHVNPNALSRAFKTLREELGLPPVRLHDLRHTHASILLKQGIHLKVVQERLGHSTIAITGDIYSHVVPGLQKAAAHSFEDAMGEVVQTAS